MRSSEALVQEAAEVARLPAPMWVTESWLPNADRARALLGRSVP